MSQASRPHRARKDASDLADRLVQELGREYVVIGSHRIRSWHGWLAIGIAVGLVSGIILIANREGRIEESEALIESYRSFNQSVVGVGNIGVIQRWGRNSPTCDGVLVAPHIVLTAAFCGELSEVDLVWVRGTLGNFSIRQRYIVLASNDRSAGLSLLRIDRVSNTIADPIPVSPRNPPVGAWVNTYASDFECPEATCANTFGLRRANWQWGIHNYDWIVGHTGPSAGAPGVGTSGGPTVWNGKVVAVVNGYQSFNKAPQEQFIYLGPYRTEICNQIEQWGGACGESFDITVKDACDASENPRVEISWPASGGSQRYHVEIDDDAQFAGNNAWSRFVNDGTNKTTSDSFNGVRGDLILVKGDTYYARVSKDGTTNYSPVESFVAPDCVKTPAPTIELTCDANNNPRVNFNISTAHQSPEYRIHIKPSGNQWQNNQYYSSPKVTNPYVDMAPEKFNRWPGVQDMGAFVKGATYQARAFYTRGQKLSKERSFTIPDSCIPPPTVTPACDDGGASKVKVTPATGSGFGVPTIVDMGGDSNWRNKFWAKAIPSGSTDITAPDGFTVVQSSPEVLTLVPNDTYYTRVWYPGQELGTGRQSILGSFVAPLCTAPDLVINKHSFIPTPLKVGEIVTFRATVKNEGINTAPPSLTRLQIDENSDGTWEHQEDRRTPGISGQGMVPVRWDSVWGAKIGTHSYKMCADAQLAVSELYETNCVTGTFEVFEEVVTCKVRVSPQVGGERTEFTQVIVSERASRCWYFINSLPPTPGDIACNSETILDTSSLFFGRNTIEVFAEGVGGQIKCEASFKRLKSDVEPNPILIFDLGSASTLTIGYPNKQPISIYLRKNDPDFMEVQKKYKNVYLVGEPITIPDAQKLVSRLDFFYGLFPGSYLTQQPNNIIVITDAATKFMIWNQVNLRIDKAQAFFDQTMPMIFIPLDKINSSFAHELAHQTAFKKYGAQASSLPWLTLWLQIEDMSENNRQLLLAHTCLYSMISDKSDGAEFLASVVDSATMCEFSYPANSHINNILYQAYKLAARAGFIKTLEQDVPRPPP